MAIDDEALFRNSVDVIWVVDDERRIVRASPSAALILGHAPHDLVGHRITDYAYEEDLPAVVRELDAIRAGKKTRAFACRTVHADGHLVPLMWSGVWLPDEEQYIFVGQDMTEYEQLQLIEKELEKVNKELRFAAMITTLRRSDVPVIEFLITLASIWAALVLALPPSNFARYPEQYSLLTNLEHKELFWAVWAGIAAVTKATGLLLSDKLPWWGGLFRVVGLALSGTFWTVMGISALWGNPDTVFSFVGLMWGVLSWWSLLRVPW